MEYFARGLILSTIDLHFVFCCVGSVRVELEGKGWKKHRSHSQFSQFKYVCPPNHLSYFFIIARKYEQAGKYMKICSGVFISVLSRTGVYLASWCEALSVKIVIENLSCSVLDNAAGGPSFWDSWQLVKKRDLCRNCC